MEQPWCSCVNASPCVLSTSWTPVNPGRRFWSCRNGVNRCGFFLWLDPPMCARSRNIIPGLLRRIGMLEEENRASEYRARKWARVAAVSWILLVVAIFISTK